MKYNININQKVLHTSKLDMLDCAILEWLNVICKSPNKNIEQKRIEGMTWVDYSTLLADMPLLRIKSKSALTPRLKRIEADGFIITKIIGNGSTKKMYVSLTDKIDSLFIENNHSFVLTNQLVHENERQLVHENEHIIILNTNHNTMDTRRSAEEMNLVKESFAKFWSSYPKKEQKKTVEEKWMKQDFYKEIDSILGFIEKAKNTDRWKKGFVKNPVTFLNQRSWSDDLAAYYDRPSSAAGIYSNKVEVDYNKKSITIKSNDRNNNKA